MIIGVAKELKNHEYRVGLVPDNVYNLVQAGHTVLVETEAGFASGFTDEDYRENGARIVSQAEVWDAEMVIKVKEPIESEYAYFKEGQILFTYLHLAANEPLLEQLLSAKIHAIGYETVEEDGRLPLLQPMSEVAGRYAVQAGSLYLEQSMGGKGKLLSGVPGVKQGKVMIIGGGQVGENAARLALGIGADVTILDINPQRLAQLESIFNNRITTLISNPYNIAQEIKDADVVIGSVLIPGRKAPVLVTEEMVKTMEPGSVIIDIAIDQGGNFETSTHATTHSDPIYISHDIIHYTVANIPGAVPQTSSCALTNATMRFIMMLADKGLEATIQSNPAIAKGMNTYGGHLTNEGVADSFQRPYDDILSLLNK